MKRAVAILTLVACSSSTASTAPGPDERCAALPACEQLGAVDPAAVYGASCNIAFIPGWRGKPVCCSKGVVYAECIQSAIGGKPCDPAAPASCVDGLVCGTDPSCNGPCCVAPHP